MDSRRSCSAVLLEDQRRCLQVKNKTILLQASRYLSFGVIDESLSPSWRIHPKHSEPEKEDSFNSLFRERNCYSEVSTPIVVKERLSAFSNPSPVIDQILNVSALLKKRIISTASFSKSKTVVLKVYGSSKHLISRSISA
jgi:hypothetical protein